MSNSSSSSTSSSSVSSILPTLSSTISNTTHSFSIKLSSTNYLSWRAQFLPLLNSNGLMAFIDGSLAAPNRTDSSFNDWFRKDQTILTWLLSSISQDIFPYIIGLDTVRQVWLTLEESFGAVSHVQQHKLHMQLQRLRKNDKPMAEFLKQVKTLKDQLSTAGRHLSLAEFNSIIYCGLGSEYSHIVAALSVQKDPPTVLPLPS